MACLDQHLIAIRSRQVLGDHVRSPRPSAAVQTRLTTTVHGVLQPIPWVQPQRRVGDGRRGDAVLWISPGVISNLSGIRPSYPAWP